MEVVVESYEQYLESRKSYDGTNKCMVVGCLEPGYYEGGDYRCYCSMCEKHAGMKDRYMLYLYDMMDRAHGKLLWDKNNTDAIAVLDIAQGYLMKMIREEKETM